ncbi:glycoside hydrolase family 28 protein [Sphingomonas faeni]|uniref:glycoside hydrolase family 28 protein n=1 Tax=Sphingomonas faeni TaxID=185950 RepID=UPI002786FE5F|nr:glycoside hydrolase family 28 protein [Sphingomonas faeni]MDQ0839897.1 polygalacturonase [Sphingomonas faeni]
MAGIHPSASVLTLPALPARRHREVNIVQHGARPGDTLATSAIAAAIESCARKGGGRVIVPSGRFRTGAIQLRSGVELHLRRGAVLSFSTDPADYPLVATRWEGVELMNFAPLIGAWDAHDVAITGEGTLDGSASPQTWWSWSGGSQFGWHPGLPNQRRDRATLFEMAAAGVVRERRVFGPGHFLRPMFVQFQRCSRVLIEGVTIRNSPCWAIHPVLSRDVTVRGVTVVGHGPNTDGCNPESVERMLIDRCTFDTGDDCIAIKSGRDTDGRRIGVPTRGVVIRDCTMRAGHGGVTIGSEISGGVSDILVERCTMSSPDLWYALRIKTNPRRGGRISGIHLRDITVGRVARAAIGCDFTYEGPEGPYPPQVCDVVIDRLRAGDVERVLELHGLPGAPVAGLSLRDCRFDRVRAPSILDMAAPLTLERVRVRGRLTSQL